MNQQVELYLNCNFEKIRMLHKTEKSEMWLVSGKDHALYVWKNIFHTGLPYQELKTINHILLPKLIYVAEDDIQTTVIEEYINGRNLQDVIAENTTLEESLVVSILLQVCAGLKLLHQKHLIHRDIKPSNLILTNDKIIKLIDFDAARIEKENTANDTRYLGTKGYAPPEQYGFGQTDCRSDIYALGITVRELLGNSYQGKLLKILNKCIQLNPKDRFQNIDQLEHAIKTIHNLKYRKIIYGLLCGCFIFVGVFTLHKYLQPDQVIIPEVQLNDVEKEDPVEDKTGDEEKKKVDEMQSTDSPSISFEKNPQMQLEKEVTGKVLISVQYLGSGEVTILQHGIEVWIDAFADWQRGPKRGGNYDNYSVYFPSGTEIIATISNNTGKDLINPSFEFVAYNIAIDDVKVNGAINQSENRIVCKKENVLKAGDTVIFSLPMDKAELMNSRGPSPSIIAAYWADNYKRAYTTISIYFHNW